MCQCSRAAAAKAGITGRPAALQLAAEGLWRVRHTAAATTPRAAAGTSQPVLPPHSPVKAVHQGIAKALQAGGGELGGNGANVKSGRAEPTWRGAKMAWRRLRAYTGWCGAIRFWTRLMMFHIWMPTNTCRVLWLFACQFTACLGQDLDTSNTDDFTYQDIQPQSKRDHISTCITLLTSNNTCVQNLGRGHVCVTRWLCEQ